MRPYRSRSGQTANAAATRTRDTFLAVMPIQPPYIDDAAINCRVLPHFVLDLPQASEKMAKRPGLRPLIWDLPGTMLHALPILSLPGQGIRHLDPLQRPGQLVRAGGSLPVAVDPPEQPGHFHDRPSRDQAGQTPAGCRSTRPRNEPRESSRRSVLTTILVEQTPSGTKANDAMNRRNLPVGLPSLRAGWNIEPFAQLGPESSRTAEAICKIPAPAHSCKANQWACIMGGYPLPSGTLKPPVACLSFQHASCP